MLSGSPLHKKYREHIPATLADRYNQIKARYKDQGQLIFDKTETLSYPDSLFSNTDHLNQYGANKYTNELIAYLRKEQYKVQEVR